MERMGMGYRCTTAIPSRRQGAQCFDPVARGVVLVLVIALPALALAPVPAVPGQAAAQAQAQAQGQGQGQGVSQARASAGSPVDWGAIVAANRNRPPDDLKGRLYLAVAYANQGMIPEATREFRVIESAGDKEFGREVISGNEQILEKEPGNIVSLNLVAFAYYALCDYRKSAGCFERLVALDPRNVWTRHYFALSLSRIDQLDRAVDVLKAALALDPSNEYTHLLLGLAYKEKGWYILAVLELARAGRAVRELSSLK